MIKRFPDEAAASAPRASANKGISFSSRKNVFEPPSVEKDAAPAPASAPAAQAQAGGYSASAAIAALQSAPAAQRNKSRAKPGAAGAGAGALEPPSPGTQQQATTILRRAEEEARALLHHGGGAAGPASGEETTPERLVRDARARATKSRDAAPAAPVSPAGGPALRAQSEDGGETPSADEPSHDGWH